MKITNRLQQVYKKALKNKPQLDNIILTVAQNTGARAITNLKNPETTLKKVDEKNEEDPRRNYKLEDVNDIARGRLVYPTERAMHAGIRDFENEVKSSPMEVVKTEDFFTHPEDGYKGYHIDVAFPNGQHSEIQFHTVQSYAAALNTHQTHAEYGNEKPKDVKERDKKENERVMAMSSGEAQKLATEIENKTAPLMAQAQIKAQNVAQGREPVDYTKEAEVAKPL